jgi:hypothetical protein
MATVRYLLRCSRRLSVTDHTTDPIVSSEPMTGSMSEVWATPTAVPFALVFEIRIFRPKDLARGISRHKHFPHELIH